MKVSNKIISESEDSGSVEGVLDVVSAHNGYVFNIVEPIFERTVKCTIPESMMEKALGAFGKRVEVEGVIRYNKEGLPLGIKVKDLSKFPDTENIPNFKKLRGIFGDNAGEG